MVCSMFAVSETGRRGRVRTGCRLAVCAYRQPPQAIPASGASTRQGRETDLVELQVAGVHFSQNVNVLCKSRGEAPRGRGRLQRGVARGLDLELPVLEEGRDVSS